MNTGGQTLLDFFPFFFFLLLNIVPVLQKWCMPLYTFVVMYHKAIALLLL